MIHYRKRIQTQEKKNKRKKAIQKTFKINGKLDNETRKDITSQTEMLPLKPYILVLADVFEYFVRIGVTIFGMNPLFNVSSPGYKWQCRL